MGCNNGLEPVQNRYKLVVQGYMVTGEKADSIQLSYPMEFLSKDSIGDPVVGAEVKLTYDGRDVELTSPGNDGFYGADIVVEPNTTYILSARVTGYRNATAVTTIPEKPRLKLDSNTISMDPQKVSYKDAVRAIQNNDSHPKIMLNIKDYKESDYYYIIFHSLESNPGKIWRTGDPDVRQQGGMRTDIFNSDKFEINFRYLRYFGKHIAVVYRITPEYAMYYNTLKKSNELNISTFLEPEGNVENGIGIFTGIACDTVEFTVKNRKIFSH
jgi:hypothetical protein